MVKEGAYDAHLRPLIAPSSSWLWKGLPGADRGICVCRRASLIAPWAALQEKRSVLRKVSSPRKRTTKKARLNPLVLLLDTALTGELEVVKEAVKEVSWRLAALGWGTFP